MSDRSRLALTVLCFLLGVGLVAQLRARRDQVSLANVPSTDQSEILGGLVVANGELRNEVQKLEGEIQAYEKASERAVLPQMGEELGYMRIVNGAVAVTGGGVEMRVGAGVTYVDLQDVLNEIRNVGAEAIALNGLRLTATSAIVATEQGMAADGNSISSPYVFQAIGDPATMVTALNRRGGVLDLLRGAYPDLEVTVTAVPLMVLPPARNSQPFVLAQPVK